MIELRSPKNVLAGILFAGSGAAGLVLGRSYEIGSAFQMGPGYFPMLVGIGLVGTGLVIATMGFAVGGAPVPRMGFRPLLFILGSVALFAFMLPRFGLIVSTILLTAISRLGGWDYKPVEIAVLAVVLAVGAALIFSYGLGIPFSLWPD